jgi:lipopolysaccharide export system permease protein
LRFTLFKYISREIWPVFFVSLMVFVFIILAANIISIMDMVINQGVSLLQFLQIVLCMLPQVILFSLPVTCLMSVMLAFIRLGSDNEIIALNASGISLYQMLAPVISFSITSLIIAVFFTMCAVPWGNRTYKDYLTGIIKSKANLDITERSFYHDLKNVVFYVNAYSQKDKEMTGVFGVDRSKEDVTNTIVAEKGRIVKSENKIYVYFNNGTIFTNKTASKEVTTFRFPKEYKWSYDLGDIAEKIATREKKPKELYLSELVKGLNARDTDPSKKIRWASTSMRCSPYLRLSSYWG